MPQMMYQIRERSLMMSRTTAKTIANRTRNSLSMTLETRMSRIENVTMSANCLNLPGCWIDLSWSPGNWKPENWMAKNWRGWNSIHWIGLSYWNSQEESREVEIQIRSSAEAKRLESGKHTFVDALFHGLRSPSEHNRRTL